MIYYVIYNCRSCLACYFNVGELKSVISFMLLYCYCMCCVGTLKRIKRLKIWF